MSVWDWLVDYTQQAYAANDRERARLYETFSEAMRYTDSEPEQAANLLLQGRMHAQLLNEPWWAMFFDHWRLQVLICHLRDYRRALDLAVEAAVETRKPAFRQFPQRVCIHEDLINTYLGIDPVGYAPLIEQALDYMAQEVGPGIECAHCVNELRTEFAVRTDQPAKAEDCALAALQKARAEGDELHAATAFCMLCALSHRRGSYQAVAEYAAEGVRAGFASKHTASLLSSLMWQAAAARKLGNERVASRAYRTAIARANQAHSLPTEEFYDAASAFYEAAGEHEPALAMRRRELAQITGRGQIARECKTRLQICSLLRLCGAAAEYIEAEIRGVEVTAAMLKHPVTVLHAASALRTTGSP